VFIVIFWRFHSVKRCCVFIIDSSQLFPERFKIEGDKVQQ